MKRLIITGLVLVVILFSLTGCFSKTSISIEKFDAVMSGYELQTSEETEYSAYTAIDILEGRKVEDKDTVIYFYVLSGDQDAKIMFESRKNVAESYKKETNTTRYVYENNISNYNTYKISTGTHFAYVARIDNTVLYIDGLENNEEFLNKIIEELGY